MTLRKFPIICGVVMLALGWITVIGIRPYVSEAGFLALASGVAIVVLLPLAGVTVHWWVNEALVTTTSGARPRTGPRYSQKDD